MNKMVFLYMIALAIFAIPLYLFHEDIFSGNAENRFFAKKMPEEKENKKEHKEQKEQRKNREAEILPSAVLSRMRKEEIVTHSRRNTLVRAIENALPSVVNIGTERLGRKNFLFAEDDPLQSLFEGFLRTQENAKTFSLGSGFVIDRSGLIVTNAHVVDRASRIHVTLSGGFSGEAEVIAFNDESDIALLLLKNIPRTLPCSKLDFSGKLFLGETVIAAGNPFGLDSSISAGVLSGTKRSFSYGGRILFSDILQTDAIVYPGNSGGPLINIKGEVIGMNVSLYKNAPGIGFAIPVQRLLTYLVQWMIPERVKKLSFGLIPGFRVDEEGRTGIWVHKVIAGTPAALAGMKPGERIVKMDNRRITDPLQLNSKLVTLQAGQKIRMETSCGKIYQIAPRKFDLSDTLKRAEKKLGLMLTPLTEEIAAALYLPVKSGLLVSGFREPALSEQIRRGDLLVMLKNRRILGEKDLLSVLENCKYGDDMTGVFLTPAQKKLEKDQKYLPMLQYRVRLRMQ